MPPLRWPVAGEGLFAPFWGADGMEGVCSRFGVQWAGLTGGCGNWCTGREGRGRRYCPRSGVLCGGEGRGDYFFLADFGAKFKMFAYFRAMKANKRKQGNKLPNLISVEQFAALGRMTSRRGHKVSAGYLYRLIRQHEAGERDELPFSYVMIGEKKRIYIVTEK